LSGLGFDPDKPSLDLKSSIGVGGCNKKILMINRKIDQFCKEFRVDFWQIFVLSSEIAPTG
jgi:hypothetical protein